jgi:hypothetical protein
MADTPSEAAMDGPGPSTTTMGASDKRPQRDETEEPDFDVTNPHHRESHCNTIPEEDIKERLADLELKIGTNTPKTDKAQRRLLARDDLIDEYRLAANEQAEYCWKFHLHINQLTEKVDELEAIAGRLRTRERLAQEEATKWRSKWADIQERHRSPSGEPFGGQRQGSPPLSVHGDRPRLVRIKDPAPFTGKDDYQINDWIFDMRNKLTQNSSEFDGEPLKIAYTARLVAGDARDFIRDRLEPGSVGQISTVEQIFKILQQAYGKSKEMERQEAKEAYRHLRQRDKPFPAFWAEFTRLTTKLGKSPGDQYDDLMDKMNLELLKSLSDKKFDSPRDLAEWCMEQENRLLLIKNRQSQEERLAETIRRRMPPRARKPAGNQGATVTPRLADQPQRPAFSRPKEAVRREFEKRLDRSESLHCYSCGKPGHMKNACPDSNKVAPIEEDCSGKADDSEADDEDADSHLLSDEEYDVDESGKA